MNSRLPGIREDGLTLVELLIAMVLSLLLMAGAIGIFISSKQAYNTEDAMSRNQEAGRFALGELAWHIRSAGNAGCTNFKTITPNVVANAVPGEGFADGTSVLGFEGNGTSASYSGSTWSNESGIDWVPNTDVLVLSTGGGCGADLTSNMGATDAAIDISSSNSCGFKSGDALLITDCEVADLFRVTGLIDGAIAHGDSSNTSGSLSRAYMKDATVHKFSRTTYYIGTSPNGDPALYRTDLDGNTEELVSNVASMQLQYGVDTGKDGVVDEYRTANDISDWSGVLTVQLSLLIRSDENALTEPQTVQFDGSEINGDGLDHRLRSVFNISVNIRNR